MAGKYSQYDDPEDEEEVSGGKYAQFGEAPQPAPFVNNDPQLQIDTGWREALNVAQTLPEHAAAAMLNAYQAPTLGWMDEIDQFLPHGRQKEEFRQKHREQYPVSGILAELGGGVATGARAGPAILEQTAKLKHPMTRALANWGTGIAGAGTYGLGSAEGSLEERLPSGATDAAIGAAAGPAAYGVGRRASTVIDPIMEYGGRLFRNADDQASTILGRERAGAGVSTDPSYDVRSREELTPVIPGRDDLNDLITNADIDPAAAQKLKTIYDTNQDSRGKIEEFLNTRQRGASRRAVEDIADITNLDRDARKAAAEGAKKAQRDMAEKGYDKIYQRNVPVDNELGDMFLGPEGNDLRNAYKKAYDIAAREGDAIPPYNQVFGEDGSLEALPLKAVDYMQRFFRKAGKPNMDPQWDHLSWRKLRDRFLERVDEAVPEFKDIRRTYATQQSALDAMEEGQKIYKMGDARDIEEYMATLSGPDLLSFRRGAIDAVEERMRNARIKSGNLDTQMQGTANQEDIIRLVFGDNYDDVAKVLAREDAFNQTYGRVLGGSTTSRNLRGGDTFGDIPMRGHSPGERAMDVGGALARRAIGGEPHKTTYEAMVRQLLSDGYTEAQAARLARAGMADEMATQFGRATGGAGVLAMPRAVTELFGGEDR